jgi:hypothetical protein
MSFVRVRHPEVDMEVVGTLPPTPGGCTDMMVHYVVCHRAAKAIAEQIITKSDKERATRKQ